MKKYLLIFTLVALAASVALADDKPATIDNLPPKAKHFLKEYFPDVAVSLVTQDDDLLYKEYGVVLANGAHIDFNSSGEWQEVEMQQGALPEGIIPMPVAESVKKNYPNAHIVRIERDRRSCEVELSNGLELTFDKHGRLRGIDD